jgi:hypothetical protein
VAGERQVAAENRDTVGSDHVQHLRLRDDGSGAVGIEGHMPVEMGELQRRDVDSTASHQ